MQLLVLVHRLVMADKSLSQRGFQWEQCLDSPLDSQSEAEGLSSYWAVVIHSNEVI